MENRERIANSWNPTNTMQAYKGKRGEKLRTTAKCFYTTTNDNQKTKKRNTDCLKFPDLAQGKLISLSARSACSTDHTRRACPFYLAGKQTCVKCITALNNNCQLVLKMFTEVVDA